MDNATQRTPSGTTALEVEVMRIQERVGAELGESRDIAELRARVTQLQAAIEAATSAQHVQADKLRAAEALLAEKSDALLASEQVVVLQRKKIASLLKECERIGSERETFENLEKLLLLISTNPHAALGELMAWRQLGMSRLAPTHPEASLQLDHLWNYVREMNSPGHRIVSLLGRRLGKTWLGTQVRKALHFGYVLAKS